MLQRNDAHYKPLGSGWGGVGSGTEAAAAARQQIGAGEHREASATVHYICDGFPKSEAVMCSPQQRSYASFATPSQVCRGATPPPKTQLHDQSVQEVGSAHAR